MNYSNLNRIEYSEIQERKEDVFFSFSKHIKEKYKLSEDILRILDLISFEELLALRMEKTLNIFNGKFALPLKEVYFNWICKAVYILCEAYENDYMLRRKIKTLLVLSKRSKLNMFKRYNKYAGDIKYPK